MVGLVGWLVRGRKKGGEAHAGVCLFGLEKGVKERENKKTQKKKAVVKRGEEAQMNESYIHTYIHSTWCIGSFVRSFRSVRFGFGKCVRNVRTP